MKYCREHLLKIGGTLAAVLFTTLLINNNVFATPANPAFTDDSFYECVVYSYNRRTGQSVSDTTNLTDAQMAMIDTFTCSDGSSDFSVDDVSDLTGLDKLTGAHTIFIIGQQITSIDLTQIPQVEWAYLGENKLSSIKLSPNLTILDVKHNNLSSINLSAATQLGTLDLSDNPISSVDLSALANLYDLSVKNTSIRRLDVSHNPIITILDVNDNTIITADIDATEEDDVYKVNIGRISSNNSETVISPDDPGFIRRSLVNNTDYYTYDAATDTITITDTALVRGYIEVAGYKLAVPINEDLLDEDDEEEAEDEEDADEDLQVPNTGAGHSSDGGIFSLGIYLGAVAVITFSVVMKYIGYRIRSRVTFKD